MSPRFLCGAIRRVELLFAENERTVAGKGVYVLMGERGGIRSLVLDILDLQYPLDFQWG